MMSDKYEDHDDREPELTEAEHRAFAKDSARYRELIAEARALTDRLAATGCDDMKWLGDAITDALGDCEMVRMLDGYDHPQHPGQDWYAAQDFWKATAKARASDARIERNVGLHIGRVAQ